MSAVFKSGAKSSEAAPRYDLIPKCALDRLAARLQFGAERHGENNYQKGAHDPEYVRDRQNHLAGHALKLLAGDDSEDHLAAIMANCVMLAWFDQQRAKTFDEARAERERCRCGRLVTRPEQCDGPPCPFDSPRAILTSSGSFTLSPTGPTTVTLTESGGPHAADATGEPV